MYLGVVCAKPTHSVPILFSQSKGQKLLGPWPNPTTSCLCKSSFMDHSHAHSFMYYLWLILCSNLELNSWDRHLGKMSIKYLLSGLHNLPVTLQEGTVLEMHLSLVLRCASQSLQVTSVHNGYLLKYPLAQMVKNLPAMQETPVWSLGQEDALEKGMAIRSSVLAWEFHGQRTLVDYSPWGCKQSDATEWLTLWLSLHSMLCDDEDYNDNNFLAVPYAMKR